MKKYLLKILPIVIIFCFIAGCKDNESEPPITCTDYALVGTWNLEGFVGPLTKNIAEAEPKDCGVCYTITFNEDGTLTGTSSTNELVGTYEVDYVKEKIKIINFGGTKRGEVGDGSLYMEILQNVESFTIDAGKLSLRSDAVYTDGHYLRFGKIKLENQ